MPTPQVASLKKQLSMAEAALERQNSSRLNGRSTGHYDAHFEIQVPALIEVAHEAPDASHLDTIYTPRADDDAPRAPAPAPASGGSASFPDAATPRSLAEPSYTPKDMAANL